MHPLILLVVVPFMLLLPGWVTLQAVFSGLRSAQASNLPQSPLGSRPLDLIESLGLSIFASLLICSVLAFLLVLLGAFNLWLLCALLALYVLAAALVVYRIISASGNRPSELIRNQPGGRALAIAMVLIVVLSFTLYSRSSETILLFRDPGTYVNTGVHIARSGSSLIQDKLYYSFSNDLQRALVFKVPVDWVKSRTDGFQVEYRFRGFPRDGEFARTNPQFFNLFPSWLAIGYSMLGIPGVLLVNPLFGSLSVLIIFLLGRRLFGPLAGIAAALLLSINLGHLWYSRTPSAEILFQLTFLGSFLCWAWFTVTDSRMFGVLAGAGLGVLTLIRVDSVLVVATAVAFLLYLAVFWKLRRRDLYFLLPLLLIGTLGLIDGFYSSRNYISLIYRLSRGVDFLVWLGGFGLVLALLLTVIKRYGFAERTWSHVSKYGRSFRITAVIGLLAMAAFAYFVRPVLQEDVATNLFGNVINRYSDESLVRLGWYLSPLGLVLATVGVAAAIFKAENRGIGLFLLVSLTFTIYYLIDLRIAPDHLWAGRRYVMVTIPFSALCIGLVAQLLWMRHGVPAGNVREGNPPSVGTPHIRPLDAWVRAVSKIFSWVEKQTHPRLMAIGLIGVLLAVSANQLWGLLTFRDQGGTASAVEAIANSFPGDAVIVFDNTELGNVLAPPLKLIHGLETFVVGPKESIDAPNLCREHAPQSFVEHPNSCALFRIAEAVQPRPVFWVSSKSSQQPVFVLENFAYLEEMDIALTVPLLEQTTTRLPDTSHHLQLTMSGAVYRLVDNPPEFASTLEVK